MSIIHGNENNFNEDIKKGKVLVDFYATWCGPCRMLGPVLEDLATDRSEIKIIKIDIDENRELAKKYGIMSVPTLMLFNDGVNISTKNGFMPKELLVEWLDQ